MRSYFYKSLLLAGVCAAQALAISLYDTAPVVGLPESHAATYNAYARLGYDDNMDASYTDKKASMYVNAGFGASFADYESVDKISYRFNLGATRYMQTARNDGEKMYADCGLSASLVHAFSARSTYSASLSITYSPEPDYASGISASRRQGDCLNWSFSNSYSQSIDSRWSWNVGGGYSGNIYSETEYSRDDRQYVNCSAGLNYRASELLSYNASCSYRYDLREYGYDSNNLTISVGFSRSLDPVSSCSGSIGLQTKMVHQDTILTPTLNLGYNRRVSEGMSVNSYLSLSNENVDTYRGVGANYLSDVTWRVGVNCTYSLSPIVSYHFGISLMRCSYSKGTRGMSSEKNTTLNPTLGMSYRFSENLTGNINYQYTWYETDRRGQSDGYERHNISTGLTYTF
ncbi:MAG: outer membrane beta-barrel protein [Akkermansia sp.]|nr:outer membrane beta-barrel protein [Akkermansia sp.]